MCLTCQSCENDLQFPLFLFISCLSLLCSRLSFYSGHSSFGMYCMLFLAVSICIAPSSWTVTQTQNADKAERQETKLRQYTPTSNIPNVSSFQSQQEHFSQTWNNLRLFTLTQPQLSCWLSGTLKHHANSSYDLWAVFQICTKCLHLCSTEESKLSCSDMSRL